MGKGGEEAESIRKALVFWPASEGNVFKKKKRCVAWEVGEELSHFSKTWQGREIQRNLMDA